MALKTKGVRATINDLPVGQSAEFPLERYDYVVSCRTRLQVTSAKRFASKMDSERQVVTITRTEDKAPADTKSLPSPKGDCAT